MKIDQECTSKAKHQSSMKAQFTWTPILQQHIWKWPFYLHIDWNMLRLGVMFTQLGNGGQNFVVAYASQSNNKTYAKYNFYEGNCFIIV